MENYIVINGKRAELTDEQLKALGIYPEKDVNPFERMNEGQQYYYITSHNSVISDTERNAVLDEMRYAHANYCNNADMLFQQMCRESLNRQLWRFSMQNGGNDLGSDKYYIATDNVHGRLNVYVHSEVQAIGLVYFKTCDLAQQAISAIVKPFMKAHPEFKLL